MFDRLGAGAGGTPSPESDEVPDSGLGPGSLSAGIHFEALEPRLLLSASADSPASGAVIQAAQPSEHAALEIEHVQFSQQNQALANDLSHTTEINADSRPAATTTLESVDLLANADHQLLNPISIQQELVVVDGGITNYEQLVTDLLSDRDDCRQIEVVVLDPLQDGVAQITDLLADRQDLDAVHFVTHGSDQGVKLGDTWLDSESLEEYSGNLTAWKTALSTDADLLFYGCNLAAGETGQALIQSIANLTGADVAASDDLTGHADSGGDWELEHVVGTVELRIAFNGVSWQGVLVDFTVDTTNDTVDATPGDGVAQDAAGDTSLRAAIMEANALGGTNKVILPANTYTLSITSTNEDASANGDLDIDGNLTIEGASAATTSIDGGALDRVIQIISGTVTISEVTITNGDTSGNGGGISNAGNLTLNDVEITDSAGLLGGGFYNAGTGTADLDRVTISGSTADTGGGVYNDAGTLTITNATITANTGSSTGAGLYIKGHVDIINSTIAHNLVSDGLKVKSGGNSATLINTILANNAGGNFSGPGLTIAGDSIDTDGSTGLTATALVDLKLDTTLQNNGGTTRTLALQTGSVAINGGTVTGAPAADQRGYTRDVSPDVGAYEFGGSPLGGFWLTTEDNVASSGATKGLDAWEDGDVLQFGDPDLTLESPTTDGTMALAFDADRLASDGAAEIDAIHYVTKDITVGNTTTMDLYAGDILFSTVLGEDFSSTNTLSGVEDSDLVVFRPDTPGDYSSGTFYMLLDESLDTAGWLDMGGVSLVEKDTDVAGTTLPAGSFILLEGALAARKKIHLYTPDKVGSVDTEGTLSLLFDGGDASLAAFDGLELIEEAVNVGGTALSAGHILISHDGIASISYLNVTAIEPGTSAATSTLLLDGNDVGLTTSNENIFSLTLLPVSAAANNAPTATGVPTDVSVTEDVAGDFDLSAVTFADIDGDSLTVTLDASSGTFAAGDSGGVTIGGTGTGTLTLTGTVAAINTYLDTVSNIQYTGALNVSGEDAATYTLNANDGTVNPQVGSGTIDITAVDDPININTSGNTVTFTEDAGATTALFAAAIDTIEPGDTITQLLLNLANVEAGDTLSFGGTDIDLNSNGATGPVAGFTYTVSSAGTNPVVTITHAGADDATVNALLNSLVFNNTSNNDPSTTARTVTLTSVTDSGSGTTADGTVATVNVVKADDAININTSGNTVTFTEDAGATTALFAAAIDTIEPGDTITQLLLNLANVEAGDTLSFGGTDIDLNSNGATGPVAGFTYTVSSAGTNPVVTITHAGADDATVNALLNSLVFNNTSNNDPSTTARTVTLTSVTDSGSGTTADGTVATVNVTQTNDAPVNTVPGAQTTLVNTALVFSSGNGNQISISDVDAGIVEVELTATNGTLTLAGVGGLTFTSGGNGTGSMKFTGTVANINTAMDGMSFDPTPAYSGAASLQIDTDDLGNTGVGGTMSDSDTVAITVNATNTPPNATNLNAAETYTEDIPLDLTNIVITDADSANVTATLTLSNPATGTLNTDTSGLVTSTFAAGVWSASGAIADVNTLLAGVAFTPTANFNGGFTIATSVDDGIAPAVTGNKVVTGTPVNDAPTLTLFLGPIDTTIEDTQGEITFAELAAQGDEADLEGTVGGFVVTAVNSGTLLIGANPGSATAWAAGTNDTIDGTNNAYWTPAADATGTLNAFTVVAEDNSNAESTTPIQAQVTVTAVNDAPTASNLNAGEAYDEGTLLNLTNIVVSDVDSANVTVTLTLSDPAAGTLSTGTAGLVTSTFAVGVWTASGAIADVNTLLAGTAFTPAAGYTADFTIATSVDDGTAPPVTGVKNVSPAAPADPTPPTLPVDDTDPDPITPPDPEPEPAPEEPPPTEPEEDASPDADALNEEESGDNVTEIPPTAAGDVSSQQRIGASTLRGFGLRALQSASLALGADLEVNAARETAREGQPAWSVVPPRAASMAFGTLSTQLGTLTVRAIEFLESSLDEMKKETEEGIALNQVAASSAIAVTTGLSVGYVAWLLRSGVLLSSLLSSMPAWRVLDPLPVLAGKLGFDEESDEESLESIIEQPSPPSTDDTPEEASAASEVKET